MLDEMVVLTRLCFVMELATGGTLLQALQDKELSLEQKFTFSIQIVQALQVLHKANIVHNDLATRNILVNYFLNLFF